jgi:hypothetical protein
VAVNRNKVVLATLILFVGLPLRIVFAQSTEGRAYIVQADDWLSKIAEKEYGDPLFYPAIVEWTNEVAKFDSSFAFIGDPDFIEIGQKVWLPPQPLPSPYVLKEGETLASIAERFYGNPADAQLIVAFTRVRSYHFPDIPYIDDPVEVEAGQTVYLPHKFVPDRAPYSPLEFINGQWSTVDETTLAFVGKITRDTPRRLQEVLSGQIQTIIVTSDGGETEGGIAVGEVIQERGLDVVVEGFCASSCANYFFTLANDKVVAEGSWVGYHGNVQTLLALTESQLKAQGITSPRVLDQTLTNLKAQAERERVLLTAAGVDQTLFDYSQVQSQLTGATFWAPSAADLAAFGLTNLDNMWYPEKEEDLATLGQASGLSIAGGAMRTGWQEVIESTTGDPEPNVTRPDE